MSAEVADLLDRARERLRTKGWQQGGFGDEEGPNCAAGALEWESLSDRLITQALYALERVSDWPDRFSTRWNDAPGRTFEQIDDLFARAAAAERAS